MLWIRDWDFNWQDRYVYKQPIDLPKGSKIDVTITYDNSADNPHNPCNPPRRVQFGMQSFDEMGAVVFQAMTVSDADEKALDDFNAAIAKAVVKQVTGERHCQAAAGAAAAVQGRRGSTERLCRPAIWSVASVPGAARPALSRVTR